MTRQRQNKFKLEIYKKKKKSKSEDEIIRELEEAYNMIDVENIRLLDDFPLSDKTKKGLQKHNFVVPTEIQKVSIGPSLRGEDILGAAKTGSGKTLAFLIPMLEVLFRKKWTKYDRVGAIVITPTRELAYQIFETLKKIGKYHDFSAGLIIGGKDLKFERKRMDQWNIVICTPGRLLQHMDENLLFDCSSVQILILDEADRCLDMGFEKTMNKIIGYLPTKRQTLLFSATQTKSVKDLARLSLINPRYISVHEESKYSTPSGLVQNYIQCDLHDKINFLWSFIKNHRSQKSLIFLSSCKQVKYLYEVFCRLKPGISLLALYGSLHLTKRMAVYNSFCQKQRAVLFATDIAARGLDFPAVNWVVQLDCPESANEYIHRAGRTARYERTGESLLALIPSEMKMLEHLQKKKIPIQEIQVNVKKLQNIQRSLEALLAKDSNLKRSAQRALRAYIKSVFLMKDKLVFDISKLNIDAFAQSLGLAVSPRIRFLQKCQKLLSNSQMDRKDKEDDSLVDNIEVIRSDGDNFEKEGDKEKQPKTFSSVEQDGRERKSTNKFNLRNAIFSFYDDKMSVDDDFLFVKRKNHELDIPVPPSGQLCSSNKSKKPCTRAALVKKVLKKKILPNKKIVFDEEGQVVIDKEKEYVSELAREYAKANGGGIDIAKARMVLLEEDKYDKELFRMKVKRKHREKRRKLKDKQHSKVDDHEAVESSDSEEDDGPDLSCLPDQDKLVVGASTNEDTTSDSTLEVAPRARKRKRELYPVYSKCKKVKKNTRMKRGNEDDDSDYRSVKRIVEDEKLALQIMNIMPK